MAKPLAWITLSVAAALVDVPALAANESGLRIDHAYARATPPGARTGGVFLTIDNFGKSWDRLVRASTPMAAGVVLHQMVLDDGVMRMRAVPSFDVMQGGRLELKPSGYHLMLIDLKQPLIAGERFPLTLTFARGGAILISVSVEGMGAGQTEPR